jgi:DNA-binding IclR family transcriptional regulator
VQSVGRAFRLLEAIGSSPSGLTQLARRVDLPVSTTSRLLGTLEGLGAVERSDDLGVYRIGPSILTMASTADASENLKALARPELEWLAETCDEAAGLSVAAGYTMHYLDQVDSQQSVQVQDWVGSRLPMHVVASGVVVLAQWPAEAVAGFLERELETPTKASIADPALVRRRLDRVREAGVAWTMEELEAGINAVAAPIVTGMGDVIGAVHLHGPAYRFPGSSANRFEEHVKAAASRIGEGLVVALDAESLHEEFDSTSTNP